MNAANLDHQTRLFSSKRDHFASFFSTFMSLFKSGQMGSVKNKVKDWFKRSIPYGAVKLDSLLKRPAMIELICALLFVLHQAAQYFVPIKSFSMGGNLDPLFLVGILYVMINRKNKALMKKWLIFLLLFAGYAVLQILFISDIEILRMGVNMIKIVMCLMILFYTKDSIAKFDFPKFTVMVSAILSALTVLALIFPASFLWTHNDIINKYDLTRLRLFYIEPSELGFHLLILTLIQLGYLFISKDKRIKVMLGLCLAANAVIMFFTRSMGSIGFGALSLGVMILMDWYRHRSRQRNILYGGLILSTLLLVAIMVVMRASLIMRVIDTINGTDASNFYRITVSFSVTVRALIDYRGIGCGFGNMNTYNFALMYIRYGFAKVLANAYLYFLVEGGIFAFAILFVLFKNLIQACWKSTSIIKWGLLTFLLVYQFFGSYFTNPMVWIVYGILLSVFDENKEKALQYEAPSLWFSKSSD